jgi:GAF domain-containing protein
MSGSNRGNAPDAAGVRLDRLERLQDLTAALSAAATPEEVARLIFERGLSLVGARAVTLFWEAGPGELELVYGLGLSDVFIQRYRRLRPETAIPSAEAYRTGAPVWLSTQAEVAARFPEAATLMIGDGDQAWAAIPLVADRSRGALELRFDTTRAFHAEEREFVMAVARQCAQALERARLYEAQKRLADRLQALQQTTAGLAGALTPAEVAAVVFRGLLGLGAHEGAIFYLASQDALDLLFHHGGDRPLLDRLARVAIDVAAPHTDAVRTGKPVWLDTPAAIDAGYPALASERAARRDGAWVAVPLALEGRSIGALALTFPEGRGLREDDRSFVLALAQQCAQALERARLYEAQKKLLERLGQIQSTSAALSGAATPRNVAEVAFRGLATLGAVAAEIHALEGLDRLTLLAWHGPAAPPREAERVAIDAPAPAAEVVRSGKALWLESPEEIVGRFPALESEREARGEAAWAVVPLLAGGTTLGAISVAFAVPHRFEPDEKAFVRMLAMPCAQALDRARLYEAAAHHRSEAEWNAATLEAMIGAAPVGLGLLDREMRFSRINAVLAQIDGFAADAHLGRTPREVLPGLPLEPVEAAFRQVLGTGQRVDDLKVSGETPAAAGVTRRFGVSLYPVRVGAEVVGVGLLVREESRR